MAAVTKLTDAEVKAIADAVLGQELHGIDHDSIDATSGVDQSGDQSLFVTLNMKRDAPIISGRRLADLHVALLEAVAANGEERFAYFNVNWPDDEVPPSPDVSA